MGFVLNSPQTSQFKDGKVVSGVGRRASIRASGGDLSSPSDFNLHARFEEEDQGTNIGCCQTT